LCVAVVLFEEMEDTVPGMFPDGQYYLHHRYRTSSSSTERMRRYRERLKQNPQLFARYRAREKAAQRKYNSKRKQQLFHL
jgi:hypothetical protein